MKNYLLLLVSLFAAAGGTVAKKYYTDKSSKGVASKCIYTAASCLVAAICLVLVGNLCRPSSFSLWLSLLFGAVTALQGIAMLVAMRLGPVSYTMLFSSFSTVITALSGVLFFHESITLLKGIGILLMLVSFAFSVEREKEKRGAGLIWLILCISVFLSTGAIGIMQKVHQTSAYRAELDIFLVLAFAVTAAVAMLASVLFSRFGKEKERISPKSDRKGMLLLLAFTAAGGICVAVNNKLNLFLSGVLESSVFFPIANGGAVVLSTLAAYFFFGERLSLRRKIGLGIGILSVVLLCI